MNAIEKIQEQFMQLAEYEALPRGTNVGHGLVAAALAAILEELASIRTQLETLEGH
jgi:hypothetical protein